MDLRERVLADEQVLVPLEALHQVARADALAPLVVAHAHDRGVEMPARPAVPARLERRVQRQAMVGNLDRNDAGHALFPLVCWHPTAPHPPAGTFSP